MASACKSAEKKIIAIYKLDFYKKKKNWKLAEHLRKEPITDKLNKTCEGGEDVRDPELDVKQVSAHDEAFLREQPEDGSEPQPPTDDLAKLSLHLSWPEQVWDGDKTEVFWEDPQQDWCGAEAEGVREELTQWDGPYHKLDLWTTATMMKLKPSVDLPDFHQVYMATKQILQKTGDWLNNHGYVVKQEEYADTHENYELLNDTAEFFRGAHYAPHSTETDLNLNLTQESACIDNNSLYLLSFHELTRAMRRHHSALTLLLTEHLRRETLCSRMLENLSLPAEEYPQLGIDPFRPVDRIVSGSHRVRSVPGLDADTGPFSGHLQPHNLIGIRMGRPYRL